MYKKLITVLILTLFFLITMACVSVGDLNDDANQLELSKSNEVDTVNLTSEKNTPLTQNNVEIVDKNSDAPIVDSVTLEKGLDAGLYTLSVTTVADANHNPATKTSSITVNKIKTELTAVEITTIYNINKNLVITLKDINGVPLSGANITVDLDGVKTFTTNDNGQVKVSTKGLAPNTYTANIAFNGTDNYEQSTKDVNVTVKKATPRLIAKNKKFKTTTKSKKYLVFLKNNVGKAISKPKITLNVNGVTYTKTINSKVRVVFRIFNIDKKGVYKAKITYNGNKYYNKVSKTVKIIVKKGYKTVSRGRKDKAAVIKIQKALKHFGYYLKYHGRTLMVDGIFEKYTVMAVKQFQHDKGLKVTGKVNEKTAKKLRII